MRSDQARSLSGIAAAAMSPRATPNAMLGFTRSTHSRNVSHASQG